MENFNNATEYFHLIAFVRWSNWALLYCGRNRYQSIAKVKSETFNSKTLTVSVLIQAKFLIVLLGATSIHRPNMNSAM